MGVVEPKGDRILITPRSEGDAPEIWAEGKSQIAGITNVSLAKRMRKREKNTGSTAPQSSSWRVLAKTTQRGGKGGTRAFFKRISSLRSYAFPKEENSGSQ